MSFPARSSRWPKSCSASGAILQVYAMPSGQLPSLIAREMAGWHRQAAVRAVKPAYARQSELLSTALRKVPQQKSFDHGSDSLFQVHGWSRQSVRAAACRWSKSSRRRPKRNSRNSGMLSMSPTGEPHWKLSRDHFWSLMHLTRRGGGTILQISP